MMTYSEIDELCVKITTRHLDTAINLDPREFFQLVEAMITKCRFYYISADFINAQIWPILRSSTDLLDVVMAISNEFIAQLVYTNTYELYVDSIHDGFIRLSNGTCTDEDFSHKLPKDNDGLDVCLSSEGWIIYLLTVMRSAREIGKYVDKAETSNELP